MKHSISGVIVYCILLLFDVLNMLLQYCYHQHCINFNHIRLAIAVLFYAYTKIHFRLRKQKFAFRKFKTVMILRILWITRICLHIPKAVTLKWVSTLSFSLLQHGTKQRKKIPSIFVKLRMTCWNVPYVILFCINCCCVNGENFFWRKDLWLTIKGIHPFTNQNENTKRPFKI